MLTPWMQDGLTALILAAQNGHLPIVQELLNRGANTDLQNTVMRGDGVGGGGGNEGWVHACWVGCGLGLGSDADKFQLKS